MIEQKKMNNEAAKKLVVMKKERKDLIESRDDKISIFEKKYKEVLS